MPEYRTSLISDFSELEKLAPDWELLWKNDPRATIFGSFPWALASWRAYGAGRSLCVPVLWHNERLEGILPLVLEDDTLRFLGGPRSDYNDMLLDPSAGAQGVESVFRALVEAPIPWRRCMLNNIPDESNIISHLPHISRQKGVILHLTRSAECPYVDLTTDAEQTISRILKKKSMKRHLNKLGRLGNLRFRHLTGRGEIKAHLPDFFRQHIARRAMEGEKSLFCDPATRAFFESLIDGLDPERELRFSTVEIDGRPVAYHFGFEDRGTYIWYKPSFDVNLWDHSPGEVLIGKLFEYTRDREIQKFDFTVGGEAFKGRFANRISNNNTLHILRRDISGLSGKIRLSARDALKRHPALHRSARNFLDLIRGPLEAVDRYGLLTALWKTLLAAWRCAVLSRNEDLIFSVKRGGAGLVKEDHEIRDMTLGDLASLAEEHGDFLTAERLSEARRMLRMGDEISTVWKEGELAYIASAGTRDMISASFKGGDRCRVSLKKPSRVIFDLWAPSRFRKPERYPGILKRFIADDSTETDEHLLYCPGSNISSVTDVQKEGFRLLYRMKRTQLLHFIRFNRVSAYH